MIQLSIDIETYSSVNLLKSGVYAYADAPDFTILLFAYAFDDEDIKIVDIACGEKIPDKVLSALTDENIKKTAFNANFERTCLAKFLNAEMPPEQWRCTMIQAAEIGLPRSLAGVATALGLEEQKDKKGRACIEYFSKPCRPTKSNGGRTRNLPQHNIEKWETFKSYCIQDVAVERNIKNRLKAFPLTEGEQKLWELDQHICDRGVAVETELINNAINFDADYQKIMIEKAQKLTGLENPKSVSQLKGWLETRTGETFQSLDKKVVKSLSEHTNDLLVEEVLELRKTLSKTSTAKYKAMLGGLCADGKVRGFLQFYGASRTGRWAGRMIQPQNLPQNHLENLELARNLVMSGDYELFEMLFGNVPDTLSQLIRTALIPTKGRRFIVSDFSAIEARVIAYLAGEKWRQEVFKNGGDIYCASASQMFKVPVVKHGINGHLRQKGKIAELALGYGGSVGALKSMGALEMGLEENELQPLVDSWRATNPCITSLWYEVEKAAVSPVKGEPQQIKCGIKFSRKGGILFISLPSGRNLAYAKPELRENKFGRPCVTYMGISQTRGSWERLETFGGKLTENIVQAFARDCLAVSMQRLESRGFEINFHVHDEVIIDCPIGVSSAEEISTIMGEPIEWAKGLVLKAEAYETPFYKKD
jgi:DNA polymerase